MRAVRILLYGVLAIEIVLPQAKGAERTLKSLEATRSRPLFSPSRRPPPPPQLPDSAVTGSNIPLPLPPPRVELTGVIFGSDQQTAILKRPDDPKPESVHLGADVEGWKVTLITPRSIVLTRADKSLEIQLPEHNLGADQGN